MKIGDIVKSRHTGQEYRVVEMNKKHKCAYVCVPINPEKYTLLIKGTVIPESKKK